MKERLSVSEEVSTERSQNLKYKLAMLKLRRFKSALMNERYKLLRELMKLRQMKSNTD